MSAQEHGLQLARNLGHDVNPLNKMNSTLDECQIKQNKDVFVRFSGSVVDIRVVEGRTMIQRAVEEMKWRENCSTVA